MNTTATVVPRDIVDMLMKRKRMTPVFVTQSMEFSFPSMKAPIVHYKA